MSKTSRWNLNVKFPIFNVKDLKFQRKVKNPKTSTALKTSKSITTPVKPKTTAPINRIRGKQTTKKPVEVDKKQSKFWKTMLHFFLQNACLILSVWWKFIQSNYKKNFVPNQQNNSILVLISYKKQEKLKNMILSYSSEYLLLMCVKNK